MLYDGDVIDFQERAGVAGMGDKGPPGNHLKLNLRLRFDMLWSIWHDASKSKAQRDAEMTYWLDADDDGALSHSVTDWCQVHRTTNRKSVRKHRDEMLSGPYAEEESTAATAVRTIRTTHTEDSIVEYVTKVRGEVQNCTQGRYKSVPSTRDNPVPSRDTSVPSTRYKDVPTRDKPVPSTRGKSVPSGGKPLARAQAIPEDIYNNNPPCAGAPAREAWQIYYPVPGGVAITDKGRAKWKSLGMTDKSIDMLLIESFGKLYDKDKATPEALNTKMAMFFAKANRERDDQDTRYLRGCERKDKLKGGGKKPAPSKEALERLRLQKARGGS